MSGVLEHKCPSCGGSVKFDADSQKVVCPYCGTHFEIEDFEDKKNDFEKESIHYDDAEKEKTYVENETSSDDNNIGDTEDSETENIITDELQLFSCNSCAAELLCDENTVATKCPYCDNDVVLTGRVSGQLKPDFIIPFKWNNKEARESLKKHLVGKKLLPKVFKDENHIDEVKGVYVPYWLFDFEIEGKATYEGKRVTITRSGDYEYKRTDYYKIKREGGASFISIPADGSSKLDDKLMESVEPFDYSDSKDFQTVYLSGFMSDKYDVKKEDVRDSVFSRAENSVFNFLENGIYGYDMVSEKDRNVKTLSSNVKYAMMPVWILNTTWKDKNYIFAMNGQTGKFVGDLPLDKNALIKWLVGVFILCLVVLLPLLVLL